MLTLFAVPKPFRDHTAMIQRNAITSWTLLRPHPQIILFGRKREQRRLQPILVCNTFQMSLVTNTVRRW